MPTPRDLLELTTETLIQVALPLTSTLEAFGELMADPATVALAAEMKADHPDLSARLREACLSRKAELTAKARTVNQRTTSDAQDLFSRDAAE